MIPQAELRVEAQMLNPPKPIGFHVVVSDKSIAVMDWDTVRTAYQQYDAMLSIRKDHERKSK